MQLIEKIVIKGKILLLSGLHIGGSKSTMDIGGLDSPVIKTPLGVPYIPGSSIKGKMRSLLAKKLNGSQTEKDDESIIRTMFGCSDEKNAEITRLIFRDAHLDIEEFQKLFPEDEAILETPFTEAKWENKIDRKSGKAKDPRQIERVPSGAIFHFEIIVDKYDQVIHDEILKKIDIGLELLQNDYLGGSGTRGYGKIQITKI